jgi:hypothetical protein
MELTLFKEPYAEPGSPEKLRLLFERSESKNSPDENASDFYLYMWIENQKFCSGFQAILDDEFVLEWHAPLKLSFGRISGKPLGRSIRDIGRTINHDRLLKIMMSVQSDRFPDLIKQISAVALGEKSGPIDLVPEEKRYLEKLLKRS